MAEACFAIPQLEPTLRSIAPCFVGLSLCSVLSLALQAIRKVTGAVCAQSLGIALGVIALSPLLVSAVAAGYAYSVVSFAVAGLAFLWWRWSHPAERGSFSSSAFWSSALPLWVVAGTTALQQWSGQFVAGAYVPSGDLARQIGRAHV